MNGIQEIKVRREEVHKKTIGGDLIRIHPKYNLDKISD